MAYPEALCRDITAKVPGADGQGWACGLAQRGLLGECFACDLAPYIPAVPSEARVNATAYPLLEVPDEAHPQKSEDDHPSSAGEY